MTPFLAQFSESAQFTRYLLRPPKEIDFPTDAFARGECGGVGGFHCCALFWVPVSGGDAGMR